MRSIEKTLKHCPRPAKQKAVRDRVRRNEGVTGNVCFD